MPRPGLRSKAQKRHALRTPGNKNVTHYWRKKPHKSQCAICKTPLQSIPQLRPSEMKKTDLTARKANRLEGGRYCAKCLQGLIKNAIYHQ
ncbi:MAG: 50S ribosomal protein L34e [Candidatus Lokiarchaeota archaeon]|nr:50S ribosomal protein L34e [Candidatus Lokiarchaeota archaeon]